MANWNLTDASNLFKTKYGKLSENTYNSANVTLGRVRKTFDFVGKQVFTPVPLSFAGGVGSGSLPVANIQNIEDALILSKKLYAVTEIDREAIKASSKHIIPLKITGNFVEFTNSFNSSIFFRYTGLLFARMANDSQPSKSVPTAIQPMASAFL